jgi:hypothetical protein
MSSTKYCPGPSNVPVVTVKLLLNLHCLKAMLPLAPPDASTRFVQATPDKSDAVTIQSNCKPLPFGPNTVVGAVPLNVRPVIRIRPYPIKIDPELPRELTQFTRLI